MTEQTIDGRARNTPQTKEEVRQELMSLAGVSEDQLSELEALGYTLDDAFYAVQYYTDDFVCWGTFELTKEALEIHEETGVYPDFDWAEGKKNN